MQDDTKGGHDVEIIDDRDANQYEARTSAGDHLATAAYELSGETMVLTHTWVSPKHRSEGLGQQIVRFALDDAAERDLKVMPMCPFVADFIRENAGYQRLVEGKVEGGNG